MQRAKGWGSGGCAVTYVVGGNSQELAAVAACVLQKPFHRRLDGRGAQEPLPGEAGPMELTTFGLFTKDIARFVLNLLQKSIEPAPTATVRSRPYGRLG